MIEWEPRLPTEVLPVVKEATFDQGHEEAVRRQREALLATVAGPIADGLAQSDVSEVIVDPDGSVQYDRIMGSLETAPGMVSPTRLDAIITQIAGMLGKKTLDGVLEGELPLDGSRVQAWLPPVSLRGPSLVIRKHRKQGVDGWPALTVDDYVMPATYRAALEQIVHERLNVLVVGSTASGKTTFAGALLRLISDLYPRDRIVTIEDTAELYCAAKSYLALRSTEVISQELLAKTAMRARPDRIVLGEVRDRAAVAMIMGMSTGHAGLSTVHGGSVMQGLVRVQQLTRLGGEDTITPTMIADAIHYVILMAREPAGPRYVKEIAKVTGWRKKRGYQFESVPREGAVKESE